MQVPYDIIKSPEEINVIREGGRLLSDALCAVVAAVRPGVTTEELDALAEKLLREGGGEPSFVGYKGRKNEQPFPTTMCTSINHEVVHAPATPPRHLQEGDVVGLDIGVRFKGYCTDMAVTVGVGAVSDEARRLMTVTREAMMRGIEQAQPGKFVSDIGRAVQTHVEREGYGVVRDLVGHGIGKNVHEEPRVPNYVDTRLAPVELKPGMVICIEPMVTLGDWQVKTLPDGWTIVTADSSVAAHFELTLTITEHGHEILTPSPL